MVQQQQINEHKSLVAVVAGASGLFAILWEPQVETILFLQIKRLYDFKAHFMYTNSPVYSAKLIIFILESNE